jgi:transposase, IS5 family
MIKYTPASQLTIEEFKHPFERQLDPTNRWVRMAQLVPWDKMASLFRKQMSSKRGRGSVDLRHVLGALLVKHIEGLSDEDTIQYIQENIYAQFFIGLKRFTTTPVFVPSLFVEIRKRLGPDGALHLNDMLLEQALQFKAIKHRKTPLKHQSSDASDSDEDNPAHQPPENKTASKDSPEPQAESDEKEEGKELPNRGILKLDATVAPQDIAFPTDTGLLNHARKISEELIDELWEALSSILPKKPRTYRREADKKVLSFQKNRKKSSKSIRKMRKSLLSYLKRNLGHINQMLDELERLGINPQMDRHSWHSLRVIHELYRQQEYMYRNKINRIDDRIVNLSQPWIRPIFRGKKGKEVEFGAKLNMSETEGFCRLDQWDFSNFNEAKYLIAQIEAYKALYGYYPKGVLGDQIYLNRENRKYLKDKGIEQYGVPLGRPPTMSASEKAKRKKKQSKRSEIEGSFGLMKVKYGMDNIKMKRADTTIVSIGAIVLAFNLVRLAKVLLTLKLSWLRAWVSAHIQKLKHCRERNSFKWTINANSNVNQEPFVKMEPAIF